MRDAHQHDRGMVGRKLRMAFVLTGLILAVEIIGAYISHSLALFSDAGHIFTDLVAVGMAWFAAKRATKPPDARNTFGYHRTGILTAFTSALMLIAIVLWVGYEAIARFRHPQTVTPSVMFVAAAVGIVVNLFIAFGLSAHEKNSLNIRAVVLHAIGDIGASVGVILGGIVIVFTGWQYADPLISIVIALLIAKNAGDLWSKTVDILMEATPKGVNVDQIVADMMKTGKLKGVHDVHIWSIAGGMHMLSAHIQVADQHAMRNCDDLIKLLRERLKTRFGITHTTLQAELTGCEDNDLYCKIAEDERDHKHDRELLTTHPAPK